MADDSTPLPDTVHLYDPDHISLSFGPANEIQFGPKGGFEANHWVGLRAHPFVPALLTAYPNIREADAPRSNVFVCEECGAEFGTKVGVRNHKKTHAK
jgi:hypothetical protein